jgi:hypothetical protein
MRDAARLTLLLAALQSATACTYGPPEDRSVAHVARIPGRAELIALIHHERFRRPTGLSAFPDGGVTRSLLHEILVYRADARTGEAELWAHVKVPAALRSVSVGLGGIAVDTVYLTVSGCSGAGTECRADQREYRFQRVTRDAVVASVEHIPDRHRPRGGSVAPMPGERDYLRVGGVQRDSLTVRLSYPSEERVTLFRIRPTGELEPVHDR